MSSPCNVNKHEKPKLAPAAAGGGSVYILHFKENHTNHDLLLNQERTANSTEQNITYKMETVMMEQGGVAWQGAWEVPRGEISLVPSGLFERIP